jgi:pseudouridine kinase
VPSPEASVVVVGAANVDLAGHALQTARLGDSSPGTVTWAPGGVARNVAARLAALLPGRAVRLVSVVGRDAWGRQLLAATRAAGVDVGGCVVLPGHATSMYLSLHQPDGELLAAVNAMQVIDQLGPARLRREAAALQRAPAWVLDANPGDEALAWLRQHRRATAPGVPVFADAVSVAKCERLRPWLPALHTLKVNRAEAECLSGLPAGSAAQAERVARGLLQQGVHQVALSRGAQGLLLARAVRAGLPQYHHEPALPVRVHSVTGAGDAMMAALVHAHLQRWPLARAASFAACAAACALGSNAADDAPDARAVWRRRQRGANDLETR